MATISTASIEGYADMTAEQKVAALEKLEVPDEVDLSGYVKKSLLDAKLSELAKAKDELKAKLTEDEQKKLADDEARAASAAELETMKQEIEALRKEKTISDYKANYLAQGYDEKLAAETAEALANGEMTKVFANAEKFKTALEAKIKADLMDKTPKPGGGAGGNENPNIEQAKAIGKAKAEANKTTADVMSHYIKT